VLDAPFRLILDNGATNLHAEGHAVVKTHSSTVKIEITSTFDDMNSDPRIEEFNHVLEHSCKNRMQFEDPGRQRTKKTVGGANIERKKVETKTKLRTGCAYSFRQERKTSRTSRERSMRYNLGCDREWTSSLWSWVGGHFRDDIDSLIVLNDNMLKKFYFDFPKNTRWTLSRSFW
jgi:hypothetical protein